MTDRPELIENAPLRYTVGTFRHAGLEARWTKTRKGAPIIVARNPKAISDHQRERWWAVDAAMWETMKEVGIVDGFDGHTILGDLFSYEV
jgi:hypothetical protein